MFVAASPATSNSERITQPLPMPEGLEQQIDPQQMADLLTFLKTWRHAAELRMSEAEPKNEAASLPSSRVH